MQRHRIWSVKKLLTAVKPDWGQPDTLGFFRNISTWQQLDNAACIRTYAKPFVSAHGNIIAISAGVNSSTLIQLIDVGGDDAEAGYEWICQGIESTDPCDFDDILKNPSNWTLFDYAEHTNRFLIQYCFSQPIEEHCRVQFSMAIIGVVIACNILKALCMLLAMRQQNSRPLVTLGDAVEDFLAKPDPTTRLACLSGKRSFSDGRWRDASSRWDENGHRWFSNLSMQRWLICNFL